MRTGEIASELQKLKVGHFNLRNSCITFPHLLYTKNIYYTPITEVL